MQMQGRKEATMMSHFNFSETSTMSSNDWVCAGGPHHASGGPNYCCDLHGSDRAVMVGPLCRECYQAHRDAAHRESANADS